MTLCRSASSSDVSEDTGASAFKVKGLLVLKDVGVISPPPHNVSEGHQSIPLIIININRVSWLHPDNSIHGITC